MLRHPPGLAQALGQGARGGFGNKEWNGIKGSVHIAHWPHCSSTKWWHFNHKHLSAATEAARASARRVALARFLRCAAWACGSSDTAPPLPMAWPLSHTCVHPVVRCVLTRVALGRGRPSVGLAGVAQPGPDGPAAGDGATVRPSSHTSSSSTIQLPPAGAASHPLPLLLVAVAVPPPSRWPGNSRAPPGSDPGSVLGCAVLCTLRRDGNGPPLTGPHCLPSPLLPPYIKPTPSCPSRTQTPLLSHHALPHPPPPKQPTSLSSHTAPLRMRNNPKQSSSSSSGLLTRCHGACCTAFVARGRGVFARFCVAEYGGDPG